MEIGVTSRSLDSQRTEHTLTYTDPKTGLELRCVGVEFRDFPAVEWTLYFKNTSERDTPILSDILTLDVQFGKGAGGECVLNHSSGDVNKPEVGNYVPLRTVLAAGKEFKLAGEKGLPTEKAMPYFNIEWGGGKGMIVVLGWPGQWSARFMRDDSGGFACVRASKSLIFACIQAKRFAVRGPCFCGGKETPCEARTCGGDGWSPTT